MGLLWDYSGKPMTDRTGAPYVGMKALFFNAETTTPRQVYSDDQLSNVLNQPVLTDADGKFPAVFLPAGNYKLRILEPDDEVYLEVDNITAPIIVTPETNDSETADQFLYLTGDLKVRYGTGSVTGYVRCNGRTIGDDESGATERANADCEDLFNHLWGEDTTLVVSTGRGGSAASDWAAGKTIALPDFRGRAITGLDGMGNSAASVVATALVDNTETADTLGATAGSDDQDITVAQMPAHRHGNSTGNAGGHDHSIPQSSNLYGFGLTPLENRVAYVAAGVDEGWRINASVGNSTGNVSSHNHSISSEGDGDPHNNMQPSMFVTIYIKL